MNSSIVLQYIERIASIVDLQVLRKVLDGNGLQKTRIVAHDGSWDIAGDMLKDSDLAKAVDIIG